MKSLKLKRVTISYSGNNGYQSLRPRNELELEIQVLKECVVLAFFQAELQANPEVIKPQLSKPSSSPNA